MEFNTKDFISKLDWYINFEMDYTKDILNMTCASKLSVSEFFKISGIEKEYMLNKKYLDFKINYLLSVSIHYIPIADNNIIFSYICSSSQDILNSLKCIKEIIPFSKLKFNINNVKRYIKDSENDIKFYKKIIKITEDIK